MVDDAAADDRGQLPPWLRDGLTASLWQRLRHLDAVAEGRWGALRDAAAATDAAPRQARPTGPQPANAWDADVALAGGGLQLLLAPLLAARGHRVVVVERSRAGQAHREWNASAGELQALVAAGLCDAATLQRFVVARYDHGTCAWHGGGSYPVRDVLDCAVDAGALLAYARALAEARGVRFVEPAHVGAVRADAAGVDVQVHAAGGTRPLRVGVLLDARGAASPYLRADLVCPTVGGVLTGLTPGRTRQQVDAAVGEILATTEGLEDGRQHLWEAFPGAPGQTTVYLFYYARRGALPPRPLASLYRRFAATLPRFKEGRPQLLRPTFGLIPGWSRMGPASRSPHPRIVLVGDAASRHSPLTFCGFGATLRSLAPTLAHVDARLRGTPPDVAAVDDRPLHQITGALAALLATPPPGDPARLNALLDAAFATLADLGQGPYAALLKDVMPPPQALAFLWRTSRRYPQVWRDVWAGLGPVRGARWALRTGLLALGQGRLQGHVAVAPLR